MMMMVLVLNKVDPPTIAATNIVDTYEGLRQDTIQRFHCTGGMHIVPAPTWGVVLLSEVCDCLDVDAATFMIFAGCCRSHFPDFREIKNVIKTCFDVCTNCHIFHPHSVH